LVYLERMRENLEQLRRGALWKLILNLLMILSFINNFSRSFSSHVIEDHQTQHFTLCKSSR